MSLGVVLKSLNKGTALWQPQWTFPFSSRRCHPISRRGPRKGGHQSDVWPAPGQRIQPPRWATTAERNCPCLPFMKWANRWAAVHVIAWQDQDLGEAPKEDAVCLSTAPLNLVCGQKDHIWKGHWIVNCLFFPLHSVASLSWGDTYRWLILATWFAPCLPSASIHFLGHTVLWDL